MDHLTDSVIEADFLAALSTVSDCIVFVKDATLDKLKNKAVADETRSKIYVGTQVWVGKFRADFILARSPQPTRCKMICVECDGAEFHSSPEQRERDGKRDKYFFEHGLEVLRFRGNLIRRDCYMCADRAIEKLIGKPKAAGVQTAGDALPRVLLATARRYASKMGDRE